MTQDERRPSVLGSCFEGLSMSGDERRPFPLTLSDACPERSRRAEGPALSEAEG
jgi:hypothetical protein